MEACLQSDGYLFSILKANELEEMCGRSGFRFASDFANCRPRVDGKQGPQRPMGKIYVHEEKYAGESVKSKIERVLAEGWKKNSEQNRYSFPALDEIAWILNLPWRRC